MAAKLEMETLTQGNGEIAEVGKQVSVHYEGRMARSPKSASG